MFDFEKFNNELDEQNAALESLLADLDNGIDEGYLSPATEMLEKVSCRLESCDTAEECYNLLTNLNVEIGKFNDSIEAMKIAAEQFQVDNDKEALTAGIAPAVESLTNTYNIIAMENVTTVGDAEIQTLRDFLTGSNELIQNKYEELKGGTMSMYGIESYLDFDDELDLDLESYMDFDDDVFDIAEEGLGDALKTAKDAVIRFITGIIERIKKWVDKLKKSGNTSEAEKATNVGKKVAGLIPQAEKAPDSETLKEIKEKAQEYNAEIQKQKETIRSRMIDNNARKAGKPQNIKEENEAYEKRKQMSDDYLANQIANKREGIKRGEEIRANKLKAAEAERKQKEKDAEWAEVKADKDREDRAKMEAAAKRKADEIKKSARRQRYERVGGRKKDRGGKRRARYAHESYLYDEDDVDAAIEALMDAEDNYYELHTDDDYEVGLEADMYIAQEGVTKAIIAFQTSLANLCEKLMTKCKNKMDAAAEGSKAEKFWKKFYVFFRTQLSKLDMKIALNDQKMADKQMQKLQKIKEEVDDAQAEMKIAVPAAESLFELYNEEVSEALENYLYALEDYSDALEACNASFEIVGTEQDFIDCAMEGIISGNQKQKWMIKYGSARKELASLTKSAKVAYKEKDYEKAIAIYKKVEAGYKSLLKVAKNMPDVYADDYVSNGTKTSKLGMAKSGAIAWVNGKISDAQAAIMKCQEKIKQVNKMSRAAESYYDFDDDFDLSLESYDDDFDI